MSKKHKGKRCVYCATNESITSDHVVAREFFPISKRAGLPQAPSCKTCNTQKSKLENYAMTILPFASTHEAAVEMIQRKAAGRLARNLKLKAQLQQGINRIWLESIDGLILPTITLPVEGQNLTELFSMIVRGLFWHSWRTILPKDYFVDIYCFNRKGVDFFRDNYLRLSQNNFIQKQLGGGVFTYSCTRGDEDPGISIWEMSFYDGAMIAGHDSKGELRQLYFCGLTGPMGVRNKISLNKSRAT